MKVIAQRDDGALLVADDEAAAIVLDGQVWYTTVSSAASRGYWDDPPQVDTKELLKRYPSLESGLQQVKRDTQERGLGFLLS